MVKQFNFFWGLAMVGLVVNYYSEPDAVSVTNMVMWSIMVAATIAVPMARKRPKADMVNHPPHYTSHPSGIEVIELTENCMCCISNAVRYVCRAGRKWDGVEDLRKAAWYVDREILIRQKQRGVVLPANPGADRLFDAYIEAEPDRTVAAVVRSLWAAQNGAESLADAASGIRKLIAEKAGKK